MEVLLLNVLLPVGCFEGARLLVMYISSTVMMSLCW